MTFKSTLLLTWLLILTAAASFTTGLLYDRTEEVPECGLMSTPYGSLCYQLEIKVACDTDSDCAEKWPDCDLEAISLDAQEVTK